MALSYNISVPIFGGFVPFISAWLIARTGDARAPSFYLMATAVLSVVALSLVARRLRIR